MKKKYFAVLTTTDNKLLGAMPFNNWDERNGAWKLAQKSWDRKDIPPIYMWCVDVLIENATVRDIISFGKHLTMEMNLAIYNLLVDNN